MILKRVWRFFHKEKLIIIRNFGLLIKEAFTRTSGLDFFASYTERSMNKIAFEKFIQLYCKPHKLVLKILELNLILHLKRILKKNTYIFDPALLQNRE